MSIKRRRCRRSHPLSREGCGAYAMAGNLACRCDRTRLTVAGQRRTYTGFPLRHPLHPGRRATTALHYSVRVPSIAPPGAACQLGAADHPKRSQDQASKPDQPGFWRSGDRRIAWSGVRADRGYPTKRPAGRHYTGIGAAVHRVFDFAIALADHRGNLQALDPPRYWRAKKEAPAHTGASACIGGRRGVSALIAWPCRSPSW